MSLKPLTTGLCLLATALLMLPFSTAGESTRKYRVDVKDGPTSVIDVDSAGEIDPVRGINFTGPGNNGFFLQINTIRGETLHLSHYPTFNINGRVVQAGNGGRFEMMNAPLPKGPNGKPRDGSVSVWTIDGLRITQVKELHASRASKPGEKRKSNNVLIRHTLENTGKQMARVGMRIYMDTFVIDNDGCLFASPVTHAGKILDGVSLQEKTLPPYFQMLQRPNLASPGYVSYLTLNVGSKYEKASKLILTGHRVSGQGYELPTVPAMGDSGMALYWDIKDIKPGAKRDVAYAYGEGIAVGAESEGRFQMALGGSFEPGKTFEVSALITEPARGQSLTLDLPAGMKRLGGGATQPVAQLAGENETSVVVWKCRVLEPGEHTVRVRSSTGITHSKVVSVRAQ